MSAVDFDMLKTFGQIAAPAGIAISAFLYLGRDILARNIFPTLTKQNAYHVVIVLAFMAWTVALAGIASWTYVSIHNVRVSPSSERVTAKLPPLPGDTGWIFAGYFNSARETFVEGPHDSGVKRCGSVPGCHDGRSISVQRRVGQE